MPPADGRYRASSPIEYAVNSAAMSASTTARGVLPPANSVAAPSDRAVATAGAMWVIDWNRTSVSPMALRSRPRAVPDDAMTLLLLVPLVVVILGSRCVAGKGLAR